MIDQVLDERGGRDELLNTQVTGQTTPLGRGDELEMQRRRCKVLLMQCNGRTGENTGSEITFRVFNNDRFSLTPSLKSRSMCV